VGVLRKLAELVVEFPDDPKTQASATKAGAREDDVLAQIERVQAELDSSLKTGSTGKRVAPAGSADPLSGAAFKPGQAGQTAGTTPVQPPIDNPFTEPQGISLPALLTIQQIYTHAGLDSKEGELDIYRIEQMLADPEMADLELSIRARTVRMTIKTMGKELHDILLDAGRRDQALDAYAQWLADAVSKVEQQVETQNAKLRQEIEEFIAAKNAQIESNLQAAQQARAAKQTFDVQMAAEEERLFAIAAPFVAPGENPVVVGGSAQTRKGDE
jgi:hypothetical protein